MQLLPNNGVGWLIGGARGARQDLRQLPFRFRRARGDATRSRKARRPRRSDQPLIAAETSARPRLSTTLYTPLPQHVVPCTQALAAQFRICYSQAEPAQLSDSSQQSHRCQPTIAIRSLASLDTQKPHPTAKRSHLLPSVLQWLHSLWQLCGRQRSRQWHRWRQDAESVGYERWR